MKTYRLASLLLALAMLMGLACAQAEEPATLGEAMALETEDSLGAYNEEKYVYAYLLDGVPVRVTAEMTEEIADALSNMEYDDNYDENFRALVSELPIVNVEDMSGAVLSQEELDAFVGMMGADVLAQGFEVNGYSFWDGEGYFSLSDGQFIYDFEVDAADFDEDADGYEQFNDMTVLSAKFSGLDFGLVSLGDEEMGLEMGDLSWLFGGLYSSVPQVIDSPEWVVNLPQAQDANQLFVVAGLGMDKTTATISMHQRDEEGNWKQILSTPGFVGRNGLCLDEDHAEGCGQTPIGVYRFNKAFGIAENPGCSLDYIQVDDDIYWSGDPDYHYNEMMNINDYPELAMDDSEHIVDYDYQYQYCLNISFNEDGTPGRGSAIFLHCFGPAKPYTGGCVAIPENIMKLVMQCVEEDCVVVIDTLDNLGGSF